MENYVILAALNRRQLESALHIARANPVVAFASLDKGALTKVAQLAPCNKQVPVYFYEPG